MRHSAESRKHPHREQHAKCGGANAPTAADFFWLAAPKDDHLERERDPLGLSGYYSRLAGLMTPDVTTMTSHGPFYYLFTYWADPFVEDRPECFFRQQGMMERFTTRREIRRAYNRMEWALTILNSSNTGIRPIGIRSAPSEGGSLRSDSVTSQSALVRYASRSRCLNGLADLAKRLSADRDVMAFFTSAAVAGLYRKDILAKKPKMRHHLSLERSKFNRGVFRVLCKSQTPLDVPQGIFLRPLKVPDPFPPRDHRIPQDRAQACVWYGECERQLGMWALKLFYRMLKASEGTRLTAPVLIPPKDRQEIKDIEDYRCLIESKQPLAHKMGHSLRRVDILRRVADAASAEDSPVLAPEDFGSVWITGRRWCNDKTAFITDLLGTRTEDDMNVHDLCRTNAKRIGKYGG